MCTYSDLLPCNKIPIYQCLNGVCDKCVEYIESIEPMLELLSKEDTKPVTKEAEIPMI
ncbi:MAG: hypothetical protein ACTSSJ_03560 [Candidatus Odinarchaeia archaeon]